MNQVSMERIQRYLGGVNYPTSKENLLLALENMGADEEVRSSLAQLPQEDFQTPDDVGKALAELPEPPSAAEGNQFLAQTLQDSMAEIELCTMALDKTANQDIKQFAQKMIDDHSAMGQEIEQLAAKRNYSDLPKKENAEQSATEKELSALSGQDFDRKFIEHNIKEHEKDIKVFSHYAQSLEDQDIKPFAKKGAGILKGHCEMAKQIREKL